MAFASDNVLFETFDQDPAISGWTYHTTGGLVTGRTGKGLSIRDASNFLQYDLLTPDPHYVFGTWAHYDTPYGNEDNPIGLYRGANLQVGLNITSTGAYKLYVGSTVVYTGSAGDILNGENVYWEIDVTVHPTAGSLEFRRNNVVVVTYTGNTKGSGTSDNNIDKFRGALQSNLTNITYDDMYFRWGAGAVYFGDVTLTSLAPTSDGAYLDYTPNSGSNRYSRVAEVSQDGDTSYISQGTPGKRASYFIPAPSLLPIVGVQLQVVAKKTDLGAVSFKDSIRAANVDYDGPSHVLTQSYAMCKTGLLTNPATSGSWFSTDFPLEIGTGIV